MNTGKEQLEKVLEQALEFIDSGKTPEEVLILFPEQRNELVEIFSAMAVLGKVKEKILPSRTLLEKIIAGTVTVETEQRYNKQGVGRLSLLNNLINKKINFLNWKIAVPAGIFVIVLAASASVQMQLSGNKAALKIAKQIPVVQEIVPAKEITSAIGIVKEDDENESIDSIINSLLDDSTSEQLALADEDTDVSLLANDFQEIDNFNQLYDEKEF
jgi:hypothetical protein